MIFIWGSKVKRNAVGTVAEWCGRCQGATPGTLREVRKTSHAYFVPLGSGRLLGHEFVCHGCGTATATQAARYASVAYAASGSFDELLAYTNPALNAALRGDRHPPSG